MQETFSRVLARPRRRRAGLPDALPNTFYTRSRNAAQRPRATALRDDVDVIEPRVAVQPERAAEVREIIEAIAERQPESCLMETRWRRDAGLRGRTGAF
ncbi:MAG: hypothetical protein M3Y17_08120 [Actinomycetota bacterium]|nr:hypothetical protein [Actinomycetota bacterium]